MPPLESPRNGTNLKLASHILLGASLSTVAALGISVTGFFATSAQASAPSDGEYSCSTGTAAGPSPKYTITITGPVVEVTAGSDCLASVVIAPGVTSIGRSAFDGGSLTSISLPSSVISIGEYAFDTALLESISIATGSALETIGYQAFIFSKIESIDLSASTSLASIGEGAFLRASELQSVILPNSVTSIGARAFEGSGLTSIVIPNSITSIENDTFRYAGDLTSATIPASVTSIASNAFRDTTSLTSIVIPNSVTSIGSGAFQYSGLRTVSIPNSVTSIGSSAFYGSGLTSIVIPNSITSISNATFGLAQDLASVTIPNSVTSIGSEAFGATSSLRSITIPASVTSIGAEAFTNAVNLASIYFLGNAPTIQEYADTFANLPASARAFVQPSATGFGPLGDFWNGLIVTSTPVYTVVYDTQGGSSVTAGSYIIASSVTLPAGPTRSGFTFAGWFTATTGGTALGTSYSPPSTGNITLYAQWTAVETTPAALAETGLDLQWLLFFGLTAVVLGSAFRVLSRRKRIW